MFYRLRKSLRTAHFDWQTRRLLQTPPIAYQEAPLTIVSMVLESDVQAYILAVKALYRRLGRGKIAALIDNDLPLQKRDLIRHHLGPVEFHILEELPTGRCQRGGTWERVFFCVSRSLNEYVIQIDGDVLCFGPIEEVVQCVHENRAFTVSEGLPIRPLAEWAKQGRAQKSDNIVQAFEVRAREFQDADKWLYVRGSSGFAGFAKGAVSIEFLETFHDYGLKVHGERWKEWGTEQLGSNFSVANSPGSVALPYPKYATFEPEYATFQKQGITDEMSLLHFIGSFRFDRGVYAQLANKEIDAMLKGAGARG